MRIIMVIVAVMVLAGCARLEVQRTTDAVTGTPGWIVKQYGAPFVDSKKSFSIVDSWLDEKNVLHEMQIKSNVDENTNNQVQALQLVRDLALQAGKAGITGAQ